MDADRAKSSMDEHITTQNNYFKHNISQITQRFLFNNLVTQKSIYLSSDCLQTESVCVKRRGGGGSRQKGMNVQ